MDVSPFPYHGPLEPDQVGGREELIADLIERVTEHRVTALLGPRRYGKTSVLRRVAADVSAAGAEVVWVDFYEVASMADVADPLGRRPQFRPRAGCASACRASPASLSLNLGVARVSSGRRDHSDPIR